MKTIVSVLVLVIGLCASTTMIAGFEGRMRVTVRDSVRSKNIPVTIIYASDLESGDNKPLVGTSTNTVPDFSVVVMGHGFQLPVTVYRSWASNIVQTSPRTVVILPETGGELFPSHGDFALDMVECLEYLQREGRRPGSVWYGHVLNDNMVAGHSMGGGCAMLAAKEILQSRTLNLRGVIVMAPAETNPSSTAAAASVTVPTLMLAGAQDCVTPLQTTVQPMYTAVAAVCKVLAVIPGASHCQFADSSFICTLGELNCRATITRSAQQARTNRYVSLFIGRKDSVARAFGDTQIQTTMSFFTGTELPSDTTSACEGDTVTIRCAVPNPHLLWLPDSVRGPQIRFRVRPGVTSLTLVSTQCFGETRLVHTVRSAPLPTVKVTGRTSICKGDSVIVRAVRSPGTSVQWSTGSTADSIIVREPGTYAVTASSACGTVKDSLTVTRASAAPVPLRLEGDTLFCDGIGSVTISCVFDTTLFSGIRWNTGDIARTLTLNRTGSYTLHAELWPRTSGGCSGSSDTLRIRLVDVTPPEPTITRRGDTLWSSKADAYSWLKNGVNMPGRDRQYCVVTEPGEYRVRTRSSAFHDCPALSGSFTVTDIVDVAEEHEPGMRMGYDAAAKEWCLFDGIPGERVRVFNVLGEPVRDVMIDSRITRIVTSDLPCGRYVVVTSTMRSLVVTICR
ncbi:MAG: hypothetical protein ACKOAG_03985 [Candidatus Kapaibacterium sp.]